MSGGGGEGGGWVGGGEWATGRPGGSKKNGVIIIPTVLKYCLVIVLNVEALLIIMII